MKMFDRLPLRARLFLLISALVLGVLVISAAGFYLIEDYLEGLEVRSFLDQESARIRERLDAGAQPELAAGVRYFTPLTVPERLAQHPRGEYGETVLDGRVHYFLVDEWRGQPLYVAWPENDIERLEVRVLVLFSIWVIVLTALAMLLAYRLTGRLVGPVAELARRVEGLSPAARGVRLRADFRGAEVERIAGAVDRFLDRLEGFVEREQSFTSATSHELRTPLSVIAGAAEVLEGRLPRDASGEPARKALERIQRAVAEMREFIDALLALARGGDTGAYRAETDLADAARKVCADMRGQARANVVLECDCDAPFPVAAPPALVHIVILNLLRNALRHTPEGRISVRCGNGLLEVSDEGEGMPPDVLERAFERHFSGAGGGSGVGLYLVKRISEQYGWKVELDSQPGRGTRVRVLFGSR